MHIVREIFRKRNEFVAVRPIRLSTNTVLEPGEKIDKTKVRLYQLQNWYRKRRIGVEDSSWAKAMLKDQSSFAKPEVTGDVAQTDEPTGGEVGPVNSAEVVQQDSQTTLVKPWEQ